MIQGNNEGGDDALYLGRDDMMDLAGYQEPEVKETATIVS